jgi:hypothetical protein
MIRRWLHLFGRPTPPQPPADPPDTSDVLATLDAVRREIKASGRAAARDAARERMTQAALRHEIRHSNFIAERLRGHSGGR